MLEEFGDAVDFRYFDCIVNVAYHRYTCLLKHKGFSRDLAGVGCLERGFIIYCTGR